MVRAQILAGSERPRARVADRRVAQDRAASECFPDHGIAELRARSRTEATLWTPRLRVLHDGRATARKFYPRARHYQVPPEYSRFFAAGRCLQQFFSARKTGRPHRGVAHFAAGSPLKDPAAAPDFSEATPVCGSRQLDAWQRRVRNSQAPDLARVKLRAIAEFVESSAFFVGVNVDIERFHRRALADIEQCLQLVGVPGLLRTAHIFSTPAVRSGQCQEWFFLPDSSRGNGPSLPSGMSVLLGG